MTAPRRSETRRPPAPRTAPSSARWRARSRRALLYTLVAAGGFLLGYLVIAFVVFPAQLVPTDAKVPNVIGLLYDDAARRLATAGFEVAQGEQRFNETSPISTVLAQNPPQGSRAAKGAKVTLDVSAGARRISVPLLVGLSQQSAQSAIENAGLELGEVTERESEAPRGAVLESNPSTGMSVAPNARIALVVSQGPALVQVPDLVGRDLAAARQLLAQIGLGVGGITVDTTAVGEPSGTVLGQDPMPGNDVRAGTTVNLRVSGSPPAVPPSHP